MRLRRYPRATRVSLFTTAAALAVLGVTTPAQAAPSSGTAKDTSKLTPAKVQPVRDGAVISNEVEAAKKAARADGTTAVVVKLKDAPLASYTGTVSGLAATSPRVTGKKLNIKSAESKAYLAHLRKQMGDFESRAKKSSPKAKVTRRLDVVVGGVGMVLPANDVAKVARDPQVQAVYVDTLEQPQTEVTPQFIRATSAWAALGGQESAGEGVIVGVLDSGIWPEHPSVSDPDPSGKAFSAPRPRTDGEARECDFGTSAPPPAHPVDAPFTCNNKLIGAYTFLDTYEAAVGLTETEYTSARDDDGHGTHTATTAAGNAGVAASLFGVPRGTVSGIAPRAHVVAYRVCALSGCYSTDSAAAVAQAIIDDVDVINFSISGGSSPYTDPVSLAFLDAYNAGVFIAVSAGNSGPGPDTTDHREPWVTTVAASTGPRSFIGKATLTSTDGATLEVSGATVTPALTTPSEVVDAGAAPYNDPLCLSGTADGAFTGKVVLCKRGQNGRVNKGLNVKQRGGVGMILYNQSTAVTDVETDNHYVPTVHGQIADGEAVIAFLAAHPGVTAKITSGTATKTQGDVMASFSSRGGPAQSLGVSKPDVTAPGVQILAGNTPTPSDPSVASPGQLFQAIAGTSMSSPHVAGAGALLAALHPDWTPGQIHSALMTTANTRTVKEDGVTPTDAFDDGSGRIDLATAKDPYFTIDETGANYLAKKDDLQSANYPSIYVPKLAGKVSVTRTIKSVSSVRRNYSVRVQSSADFPVSVSPSSFSLAPGASKTLTFTMDGKDVPLEDKRFATVVLKSGKRAFTIPVTAVRQQGPVEITKTCDPAETRRGATTSCAVTVTNGATAESTVWVADKLPTGLRLVPGSVQGGTASKGVVRTRVTLPGRESPQVNADYAAGSSPAGYLPLSAFGIAPISGIEDESIANFSVPSFTVAGETYDSIGIVSNGYVVLGGGTGQDVQFINEAPVPDASLPNNYLAPFWTDLNPEAGGAVRIGTLTDGVNSWIIVEYEEVPEFSTKTNTHSFQVWIGLGTDEDVTMTYGPSTGQGDLGALTVGVENPDGTQGEALYLDGVGTLPTEGDEILVTGTPGATSSATMSYTATGVKVGSYVNYAVATGNTFSGTAVARFAGSVVAAQ